MKTYTQEELDARDDRASRSGREKWWVILAGGLVALLVAGGTNFGQRVMSGSETSAVMTSQITQIVKQNDDQNRLLQDLNTKTSGLYTREEARADREALERRFASIEGRIGDLGRRLETVEATMRMMQQLGFDKPQTRRQ